MLFISFVQYYIKMKCKIILFTFWVIMDLNQLFSEIVFLIEMIILKRTGKGNKSCLHITHNYSFVFIDLIFFPPNMKSAQFN